MDVTHMLTFLVGLKTKRLPSPLFSRWRENAFILRSQAGPLNVPVAMATRLRTPVSLSPSFSNI